MKTIEQFLSDFHGLDVQIWVEGDKLRYSAPKGTITPDLLTQIGDRKSEIIKFLQRNNIASTYNLEPITPVSRDKDLPLSFAQQRMWFLDQFEGKSAAYNLAGTIKISGLLQVEILEQSFREIVQRHEALRTTFKNVNGQPIQVISPTVTFRLPLVDLRPISEAERDTQVQRLVIEEAQRPFNLTQGSLLRATLLQLGDTEYLLVLVMHHIVSDGWSIGRVLFYELNALYEAFLTGKPLPLPKLPIQYADFAVWQRQYLQGEVLSQELSYWKQQLDGAPTLLQLPTDRSRSPVQSFRGTTQIFELPQTLNEALKALSKQAETTLFMTLLAAFNTLLYRYTGAVDILVGSPIANRNRTEIEGLIGCFVNTLVLRTDLSGNPSFRDLLKRVREVTLDAYAHQNLPFEKLVEELHLARDLSHPPLFQVMFSLQDALTTNLKLPGLTLHLSPVDTKTAMFDLTLDLIETESGLAGRLEYNTDLFEADVIARLVGHFQRLLERIAANPDQRLSDFPLLSAAEQQQFLTWNCTQVDYPHQACIHQLFEAQVEQTPDAIAVVFEHEQLTYRELNQRANQLAHYLERLGIKPDILVGICMERSLEMVVGLLGILKAGGAYVPLDPTYPKERLAFMLSDAQVSMLLTQEKLVEHLAEHQAHVVCLDRDWRVISQESRTNPDTDVQPDNLVYVIYTSGSTGKPKGVMIRHQSLVNFTEVAIVEYGLSACDRVLQFASISFDAAAEEIYPCLMCGGTLVLRTDEMLRSIPTFVQKCWDLGLTVLDLPTAYWHQLTSELANTNLVLPDSLRLVIIGGEPAFLERVKTWQKCVGNRPQLVNTYGPTEATVVATIYKFSEPATTDNLWREVPIGHSIRNVQVYVLDQYLQPVLIGVPGELYIGGAGLARGYLNRPELTAEKFISNPFKRHNSDSEQLYKTGDLVRYLPDGNIEFLGRIDHQVKIRGFRIELGEIEAVLAQHPRVREAVVIAREDQPGDKRLVAYVVDSPFPDDASIQNQALTPNALRDFLLKLLPDYMVPNAFVILDAMPLTPNGKVNHRALPIPDTATFCLGATFVAPRNSVEQEVAEIWVQVLGIDKVGIYDNFFLLGGHSLLATQVISRIQKTFEVELPLRCLFESPTVAGLAEGIQAAMNAELGRQAPPIDRISRNGNLPLSFAQERLWLLEQLQPGSLAYHTPAAIRLDGSLDIAALEQALNEILRRHEVFRTTFSVVDGQPVQTITPFQSVSLPVVNLGELPDVERSHKVQQIITEWGQNLFDLAQAPLLRWMLLRVSEQEHLLLLSTHHIVCDGWSAGVFVRELATLYDSFSQGQPSPLPELPIQYADFAIWQRQWLQGDVLETQLTYWKRQLGTIPPVLKLPTQHSSTQTSTGKQHNFPISPSLTEALKTLCQQEGMTLFMTLLAAFKALLYRYSTQHDIVVGSPIANRNRSEIEELIGFFANTLVLRTNLSGNPSFRDVLKRVREVTLGAYAHQDLPFEKLVAEVQPERHLGQTPLYQVWFVLQNAPMPVVELSSLTLSLLEVETGAVRHDLKLDLTETPEGIQGFFEYKTDLFEASTIARMIQLYETLLETVIEQPDIQLNALVEVLENAEKQQQIAQEQEFKTARRQKLGSIRRKPIKN
jgi:amino acid adenylation domain-containing protein